MKPFVQRSHLQIYRPGESTAHIPAPLQKNLDAALLFVSFAGLISAVTFLITM